LGEAGDILVLFSRLVRHPLISDLNTRVRDLGPSPLIADLDHLGCGLGRYWHRQDWLCGSDQLP
jgi:hypothetical protein